MVEIPKIILIFKIEISLAITNSVFVLKLNEIILLINEDKSVSMLFHTFHTEELDRE